VTADPARRSLHHALFAWTLKHGSAADRRLYGERKARLLGELRGMVVDVGAGAGVNLAYLHPSVRYVAVEPNVYFHRRIRKAARRAGVGACVVTGVAEALPFESSSVDAVLATLVLCSVADPSAALAEVRRVLRPGGVFVFIEHVAAPRGHPLRLVQKAIRPLWGVLADGCRPDRDTVAVIERAGFAEVEIERFSVPLGPVSPHVAGRAVAA
jgi:ubiquinone/menaquinone biosynthesis C-methylase UbiE